MTSNLNANRKVVHDYQTKRHEETNMGQDIFGTISFRGRHPATATITAPAKAKADSQERYQESHHEPECYRLNQTLHDK
jgi:hypothetical protein